MTDTHTHIYLNHLQHFTVLKAFIYIISLNSQNEPTDSSLTEEETEAETGNSQTITQGKSMGSAPGDQARRTPVPGAVRLGLGAVNTHLSCGTFHIEGRQPRTHPLSQEIFIEILLCATCWRRSQEQGSEQESPPSSGHTNGQCPTMDQDSACRDDARCPEPGGRWAHLDTQSAHS